MTQDAPNLAPDVVELLGEAAAWRLLSLLFARPRPGWSDEVRAVAAEVRDPLLADAAHAAQGATEGATEGAYLAFFGPGGRVSPRAVSYLGGRDPGRALAELQAAHNAFAFSPRSEEPIDHVSVLAEFVSYLYFKEAFARFSADPDAAAVTAAARARVLADTVVPLFRAIAAKLPPDAPPHIIAAARAKRAHPEQT